MATSHIQASGLLHYNSDFQVLICRKCQYAIQKSAVDSHLLKHKIYRGERQRLLAEIAQLELIEPDDIPQPSSITLPVEALSVLQGYRCTIAGCRHLTISNKGMKRHWSVAHGLGESLPPFGEFTRPVNLQTFFKGTKIRYFEVSLPKDQPAYDKEDGHGFHYAGQQEIDDESFDSWAMKETQNAGALPSSQQALSSTKPQGANLEASLEINLEMLRYFHHFGNITAPTLPGSYEYWQTKIVSEALQHRGIMSGLLAISACHLTILATDLKSKRSYHERQTIFSCEFTRTFCHHITPTLRKHLTIPKDLSGDFVGQVWSLMRCAQWATAETSMDQAMVDAPGLEVILDAIHGGSISEPAAPSNDMQERPSQIDRSCTRGMTCPVGDSNPARNTAAPVLFQYIRTLPSRMAETLGRPGSTQDLFATLSAIEALVECCDISFASDEVETAWQGASAWLTKVSASFNAMVTRHDPAAMVVIAHWAAILVKRAELVGCWFLKGAANAILLHVVTRLTAINPATLCLVENLLNNLHD